MKTTTTALIFSAAIIIGAFVFASAYKYKFKSGETISVTGMAEKDFNSDLIVWSGSFSRTGAAMNDVYAQLKTDEQAIRGYLKEKGIPNESIIFTSVTMNKNFQRQYDEGGTSAEVFSGYTLTGNVRVQSNDIDRVEKMSREITELLEKGIELSSNPPDYYYTKLNELKIDLLAKASVDAKKRAETIAKNSGSSLGGIKKATMGVFQITGKNENETYSYGGSFNTNSKLKTASITLKTDYLIR